MLSKFYQAVIKGNGGWLLLDEGGSLLMQFDFSSQSGRGIRCKTFSAHLSDLFRFLKYGSLTLCPMRHALLEVGDEDEVKH